MLPFTLVIVLFISIYYSYITITQWLVGSEIKAKRGVASAKKCTACGPVYAAHVQTYLFCTLELNDDYYNVLSDLNPLAARWKNIGFALRLKPDALERIDREHGGDLSACLASMVKEWLKRNYNVERFGKPTWQRLAEAVGDPAGGADKALSKRIAEKHSMSTKVVILMIVTLTIVLSYCSPAIVSINRGQADTIQSTRKCSNTSTRDYN